MTKFLKNDKPWASCGSGTLDDPEIIWLKEPLDLSMRVGAEQVGRLLAAQESLTHVWLRSGTPPYGPYHPTTSDATGNRVNGDNHLTVYCRQADGRLLEGHVYRVIDGQSGNFTDPEARKQARAGHKQPVELYSFNLDSRRRRNRLMTGLLEGYENWLRIQGQRSQQNP